MLGEIVVDNDDDNNDPAAARFSASSNWTNATVNSTKYLNDFRVAESDGPTNDGAAFYFYVPSPGSYSVYAWWGQASHRTTSASYLVFEVEFGTMFPDTLVDQRTDGGQWNLLGTWDFTEVGWAKVLMSRSLSGPGKLAADAVRAVRR